MLFQLSIFNFLSTFKLFIFSFFKLHYCSENVRYDILATTFARGIYGNPRLQSPNLPKHQLLHTVIWKSSCACSVVFTYGRLMYILNKAWRKEFHRRTLFTPILKPQINIKFQSHNLLSISPINHNHLLVTIRWICFILAYSAQMEK